MSSSDIEPLLNSLIPEKPKQKRRRRRRILTTRSRECLKYFNVPRLNVGSFNFTCQRSRWSKCHFWPSWLTVQRSSNFKQMLNFIILLGGVHFGLFCGVEGQVLESLLNERSAWYLSLSPSSSFFFFFFSLWGHQRMIFTFNDNSLSKVLVPLRTIFNVVKILDYGATK